MRLESDAREPMRVVAMRRQGGGHSEGLWRRESTPDVEPACEAGREENLLL